MAMERLWKWLLVTACCTVMLSGCGSSGGGSVTLPGGEDPQDPQNPNPTTLTASFTVTPSAGTTETTFLFDASASSDTLDSSSALQVRWDWNGDGTYDTDASTTKTANHRYTATGEYIVKMEVKNSAGTVATTQRLLVVNTPDSNNTPPIARCTVSPNTGATSTVFAFNASASWDAQDSVDDLHVRWDWENDGNYDTPASTEKRTTHQFSTAGTYTVRMELQDTGGMRAVATVTVTVSNNTAPTASFTVSPTTGTTDDLFTVNASGCSDKEEPASTLQVRWDWEGDGTFDTDWSTTKTASHRYPHDTAIGKKTIVLQVKDGGNAVATAERSIQLSRGSNTAPTAMFTIDTLVCNVGDAVSVDASSSFDIQDPTPALAVRWDWESDEQYDTGYSTIKKASFRPTKAGTQVIRLEVRDTLGMTSTTTRSVIVIP